MKKLAILLIVVGVFLRLFRLDSLPPHLSYDEISVAYDAYSVAKNGMDEHGHKYPLSFQSYGTYKAPLYSYTLIPFQSVLGNHTWVARIPSALAGLAAIWLIGLIAYELTKDKKVAWWSSAFLAITPWHIVMSRMAFEANLALMFLSLGILMMLKRKLWLTVVFLVISMYGYHTEWLLVPVLMLFGGVIYFKKDFIKFALGGFVLAIPLLIDYRLNAGNEARMNTEMIWNTTAMTVTPLNLLSRFLSNYLSYFNPVTIFSNGLVYLSKNNPFTPGLILWPMFFPLLKGLKNMKNKFFWIWLFVSPITAALTNGDFSPVRNLNSVLPLIILVSVGMHKINKAWWGLMFVSLFCFFQIYFFHFPYEVGETFQSYRPVAEYLKTVDEKANDIYVDYRYGNYRFGMNTEYFGVPHLFLAYFNRWDPRILHQRVQVEDGVKYGKYLVGQIDWNKDIIRPNRYFVVSIGNPPDGKILDRLEEMATFNDPSGRMAFQVWRGK